MRKVYFIDLFCGAGGTSTGVHNARYEGMPFAEVLACVNHDAMAIASHAANHPGTLHYTEDIRTLDISHIVKLVKEIRSKDPFCLIILWASLECTNFSRAKGGQPRDADSRTLAEHLFRYIDGIDPDGVWIENVDEFMSWGPLDENGRPVSKKAGCDYMRWVEAIKAIGYDYDYRILNSADFGAYTSRKRYFAQFNKDHVPTVWPLPTHSKTPGKDMFSNLKPWNAVKECLDFSNEGNSIFGRKKELSDKTLERIYAGLIKYVAGGKEAFLVKWNSYANGAMHCSHDVTTQNRLGVVKADFMMKYHGHGENVHSIESPATTLSTKDRLAKVKPCFFVNYQHSSIVNSVEDPCPTIQAERFLDKTYGGKDNHQSIEIPAGTVLPNPKHQLVTVKPWVMNTNFNNVGSSVDEPAHVITANRKHHYLMNPQFASAGGDLSKPCFTLIAKMDKRPPYLVSTESGEVAIAVFETDSPAMVKIKEFMAMYGIVDIKMRMLVVPELLKIQGFPDGYVLKGTQADQKKFIGNSVVPHVVTAMCEAMYVQLLKRMVA